MDIFAWLGWVATILTIIGVSLRDVPEFQSMLLRVRLPYLARRKLRFWQSSLGSLSLYASPTIATQPVEKFLYELHGWYHRHGIASQDITQLGSPGQFIHRTRIEGEEYEAVFLEAVAKIITPDQYENIYIMLKLWSPYLYDGFDSRICEVIQTATLVYFDFDIPAKDKLALVEFIEDFFLRQYLRHRQQNVNYSALKYRASSFILPLLLRLLASGRPYSWVVRRL